MHIFLSMTNKLIKKGFQIIFVDNLEKKYLKGLTKLGHISRVTHITGEHTKIENFKFY